MEFPASYKYTKDHEWIDVAASQSKVGVTAYAVDQLGDIVHVELPKVGASFDAGAAFGTIESTKTVSDLYMPVSGKVVAVNQAALDNPESLQQDPYQNGWLVQIELTNKADAAQLMDAKAYESFVRENAD